MPKLWSQCASLSNASSAWVGSIGATRRPRLSPASSPRRPATTAFRRNENPIVTLILQGSADAFATVVELGRLEVRDTGREIVAELFDVNTSTA